MYDYSSSNNHYFRALNENHLQDFQDNIDIDDLDDQIEVKTNELAILLEIKEGQLKEEYNNFFNY